MFQRGRKNYNRNAAPASPAVPSAMPTTYVALSLIIIAPPQSQAMYPAVPGCTSMHQYPGCIIYHHPGNMMHYHPGNMMHRTSSGCMCMGGGGPQAICTHSNNITYLTSL